MMDIVKLLREAGDVYHDIARDMLQNEWKEHLAPHYTKRGNELQAAAAEVESAEPDYWVSTDGVYVDFGMRSPGAEDDGANWCARTEVNQHINDCMGDQTGLRLHLEGLYRHPPSAVPEGWKLVPVEPTFEMLTAADTESVNKNGVMAMTRAYKAMLAAAPGAGGGE